MVGNSVSTTGPFIFPLIPHCQEVAKQRIVDRLFKPKKAKQDCFSCGTYYEDMDRYKRKKGMFVKGRYAAMSLLYP